jgi:hypothetical protein
LKQWACHHDRLVRLPHKDSHFWVREIAFVVEDKEGEKATHEVRDRVHNNRLDSKTDERWGVFANCAAPL